MVSSFNYTTVDQATDLKLLSVLDVCLRLRLVFFSKAMNLFLVLINVLSWPRGYKT